MNIAGKTKGIITAHELQKWLKISDYREFYEKAKELEAQGEISPVKKGKELNGKVPPLARRYRIINQEKAKDWSDEINQSFPLRFRKDYYKNQPAEYEKDRDVVLKLCHYHKREDSPLSCEMSINERSYDITMNEKWLSESGFKVLKRLGLDLGYLNVYQTPEPFFYHSVTDRLDQAILIVENKDTWFTIRKLMDEENCPFGTAIYGEGKKILSSIKGIPTMQEFFATAKYYYFGDIDDEGALILDSLQSSEKHLNIVPWEDGYRESIRLANEIGGWRRHKSQKDAAPEALHRVFGFLGSDLLSLVQQKFLDNLYIPQEILSRPKLTKMWRG